MVTYRCVWNDTAPEQLHIKEGILEKRSELLDKLKTFQRKGYRAVIQHLQQSYEIRMPRLCSNGFDWRKQNWQVTISLAASVQSLLFEVRRWSMWSKTALHWSESRGQPSWFVSISPSNCTSMALHCQLRSNTLNYIPSRIQKIKRIKPIRFSSTEIWTFQKDNTKSFVFRCWS